MTPRFSPTTFYYPEPPVLPRMFPRWLDTTRRGAGANLPLAAAIKKVVDIPVMTVGRLDRSLEKRHLETGQIDFVAFTASDSGPGTAQQDCLWPV